MKKNTAILTAALLSAFTTSTVFADTTTEFRKAVEEKGGTVTWNSHNRSVMAELNGKNISFIVGSGRVIVDGQEVNAETRIVNNRTMISTGFINQYVTGNNQEAEMSNSQKALALINSFASGDTSVADNLMAEGYIQHNLAYGTGREAFKDSIRYLASAPTKTTVENIRVFEDEDYVFLQTVYNFAGAGEQVAFDIFRFDENGQIAEHWDNLAALAEPNPSGHTQIDGTMELKDLDKTEENRALVKNFLYDVMQGNHLEKTPEYFNGDTYIQHNTGIADGVSGLNEVLAALAEQGIEMIYDEIHMVLAQGNYVLTVSEGTFGGVPTSYYDLWRVEDGKIAEHWDVMETIADPSTWANENGKF